MSKASEWADAMRSVTQDKPSIELCDSGRPSICARVDDCGDAVLNHGTINNEFVIQGKHAAALGRWLLDTFGEEPRHEG